MHPRNCFINLTFDDEHLPEDYSVNVRHLQLFMKKLRDRFPHKIRFYACGEYGPLNLRPHYHAILFNHDFEDKVLWQTTDRGDRLYTSKLLEEIWGHGFCTLGDVTYQSAGYVAQYCMKKINGDRASTHYIRTHPRGYVVTVKPEFSVQSRRPGIGTTWFEKYKTDAFPSDFLVIEGKPHSVPSFYTKKLQEEELTKIKRRRKKNALPRKADNTPARLRVRETVKASRLSTLKREL